MAERRDFFNAGTARFEREKVKQIAQHRIE